MRLVPRSRSFSLYLVNLLDALRPTFIIPRRFNPTYSLLGRWIQHLVHDERRAEVYFIIVLCSFALALLLTQYLAWALLQPLLFADPSGSAALTFWLFQLGSFLVGGLTCVLGFKPSITIASHPHALHFTQGRTTTTLPYTEIREIETLSALRYHRHYRRYAATRSFVNRIEPLLLLLHTSTGPVVIGLQGEELTTLKAYLESQFVPAYATAASAA